MAEKKHFETVGTPQLHKLAEFFIMERVTLSHIHEKL